MINKILRTEYQDVFDSFIDDFIETSYEEHRRDSNFFTKRIIWINEDTFPHYSALWGYWETNIFVNDLEYGYDSSDIYQLTRVTKEIEIIETVIWIPVK